MRVTVCLSVCLSGMANSLLVDYNYPLGIELESTLNQQSVCLLGESLFYPPDDSRGGH